MRAWILLAAFPLACTSVDGKLTADGQPLGNQVFVPDDCSIGSAADYAESVTLVQSDSWLRVHVGRDDVNGKIVVVEAPGYDDPGIELREADCRVFDLDVSADDCGGYDGHVDIDCDLPAPAARTAGSPPPGTLHGKVTFGHCY